MTTPVQFRCVYFDCVTVCNLIQHHATFIAAEGRQSEREKEYKIVHTQSVERNRPMGKKNPF